MTDLISRADIPYHTQLEPMGNGQYSDVEVAYKTDIDALPSAETTGALDDAIAKYVEDGLMELPSADAVQGEWIDIDNYYRLATCSHCHKITMFEKWGEYTKPYDFCPNCGARMYKGGAE